MSQTNAPRFRIGKREYEMPQKFTLGEMRLLKREFDVTDMTRISKSDPDHIAGMLFIAIRRVQPMFELEHLEALDLDRIELIAGEGADADPFGPPSENEAHEADAPAS